MAPLDDDDKEEIASRVANYLADATKEQQPSFTWFNPRNTVISVTLLVPIAGMIWWLATYSFDFTVVKAQVKEGAEERKAMDKRLSALEVLVDRRKQDRDNETSNLRRDLDVLFKDRDHVEEMWWMKLHGVSNKEDFERRNGFPAPNPSVK